VKGTNVARQDKKQVDERRQLVAEWTLKGWTQQAIARRLGVSQPVVSRDLRVIREQWRKSTLRNFDEARGQQLQKLLLVETEAWAAWQRSQDPVKSASLTDAKGAKQSRTSLKHTCGDPRFLEQVNKCIAQRCLLLGLQPVAAPQEKHNDASVSIEVEREWLAGLVVELGERERVAQARAKTDDGQPGGPGGRIEPGEVAPGQAPDLSRPDIVGSD
jgi:hypothetical protein